MIHFTFLEVLDQLRYIIGEVAAFFVFFANAAPRKKYFPLRVISGLFVCVPIALMYLFLYQQYSMTNNATAFAILSASFWIGMVFLVIYYMIFCYEISFGYALFRGFMAIALESLVTTLLKYVLVSMWFPELPEKYTVAYIAISIAIYVVLYTIGYKIIAKRMQSSKATDIFNNRRTVVIYVLLILIYSLVSDASKGICEWLVQPMKQYESFSGVIELIQYYSIGVMVLLCLIVLVVQYYVYGIAVLQNEKGIFSHLLAEKKVQYENSRENIDIINQKCHDLKHQILALEGASEQERKDMITETKKAVMFYDAVVKTNNEVLNIILTEKSLVCANRNIKLTCMANAEHLSMIGVIDLYTILGNALDNAIECVEEFQENDKKMIGLTINEHGKMLLLSVENYYEKPINFRNDLPLTSKKDKRNHGLGLRSIKMIMKKYGGDIRIHTENQIFSLQMTIPLTYSSKNGDK